MNRLLIGSGDKSALLLQFLAQEFQNGITLLDPTSSVAKQAANRLPVNFTQHTIYFDPSDTAHVIGLNVLEDVPRNQRHKLTEQLCSYFEAMWPNGWGAQSNFILANCIRLLLDQPRSTLLGVLTLIADPESAENLLKCTTDPVLRINWSVIRGWDRRQYQSATAPLLNKIGTLLLSPTIRNIVGQQKTTLGKATIVIANLDRAKIGDTTSKLLGGLLVTRATGPIAINDYGFFASPLPLTEDRFTLAVNFLDELSDHAQQQILSIEDKYVFKTSRKDADELSFHVGLLNPRILTELRPGEAYNTREGHIWPEPPLSRKRLKAVRNRTRACHTRPRHKIENLIARHLRDSNRDPS
jgi:hypothetical protein